MIWEADSGLDEAWKEDAAAIFMRRLRRRRATSFMENEELLKHLRYDNETAKKMQKWFGDIWAERNTDIYKLIAKACGQNWDSEDEQKSASEAKKESCIKLKENDDLVTTREASPRGGLDKLQRKSQKGICQLEEKKRSPEKTSRQEAARKRRGDFYSRAGGT